MTYDPRQGGSPYLGMDMDDDEFDFEDDVVSRAVSPDALVNGGTAAHRQSPAVVAGANGGRHVPTTVRRASDAPRRGVTPRQAPAAGAGYHVQPMPADAPLRRPVPSPPQNRPPVNPSRTPRTSAAPARGFLVLGSFALRLLALIMRLAAIVLSVVVIASAVLTDSHRYLLVQVLNIAHAIVPAGALGRFVFETPLGGALRGDLILVSVALFVVDWLCLVYATSLRNLSRRGA